jgi:hypothetical protein
MPGTGPAEPMVFTAPCAVPAPFGVNVGVNVGAAPVRW